MRYKCLVLDHDDTVVNSTAVIHYPSFLAYMQNVRPGLSCTLEEYFRKNFDPGIMAFFSEEIGLNKQQMHEEFLFWQEYLRTRIPDAYPGIREILQRHRAQGGIVAVVSHSVSDIILRDYRQNDLPEPDIIFGWEQPPERRKPYPWPLQRIMELYDLQPQELLMIDDLKPGYDMALSCGVDFAAAGWANDIEQIEQFMRRYGNYYFKTVAEFARFLEE